MYHQSEELSHSSDNQFVSRLLSWPVVATALDQVNAIYVSTKEKNQLLKLTMETAESGVSIAITTATPVISKFEKQISSLNGIACVQLDKLEQSCPIVKRPTDEVVKATKDLCNSAVKPLVDRVSSAKQYGYDTVSGVRVYAGEKLNDVKNYGLNKVGAVAKVGSDQMSRVLATAFGQAMESRMDEVLDIADHFVDSHLPPDEDDAAKADEKGGCGDKQSEFIVSRAFQLGSKVRRRMYSRGLKQLHHVQLRSKETLNKLNFTVDLIEFARTNLNGAKDKMHSAWDEINKMESDVAKEAADETTTQERATFERKAIATARHLTQKLKRTLSWLHVPKLPIGGFSQLINTRVENLQNMAASLSNIFSKETTDADGVSKAGLDSARSLVAQMYSGLLGLVSVLPGYEVVLKHLTLHASDSKGGKPLPVENSSEEKVDKEEGHSHNVQEEMKEHS